MKIVVTGASGLIGSALVPALRADGHEVVRLVRREPAAADEARWDPEAHTVDEAALVDCDAVVNLAGAGVGDHRWTRAYKQKVLASRVDGTTTISTAIARLDRPPSVLLSASAIGFYGDTGAREVDETAPRGDGFLAGVTREWEACTSVAEEAGIRVAHLRTGIVLAAYGGALGQELPLFKLGVGGRLGSGRQYVSWISLADEVAAIAFLLTAQQVSGPVNLVAPQQLTNAEYTRAVARAVHRPAVFPVPGFVLRLVLGGFAGEAVLAGQRVLPRVLTGAAYPFRHADIDTALQQILTG